MSGIKAPKRVVLLTAVATVGAVAPGAAHAGGFYLQEQSVRGAGRAFSGEVADQGAASLWWNPAAIGGVQGGDAHIGFSAILPRGNVDNYNTVIQRPGQPFAPVGGDQRSRNPINNGYLPTGAVAYGITPQIAVGLALTSPYSFTTDYDASSWARYTADKTELRTYDIQPSIAFQPMEGLSIGAALNIEYSKASLGNYLPNLAPGSTDGHQELTGDGWDFGWSAGAQYVTGPVSLGVAYKSGIKHNLKGTMTVEGLQGPLAGRNGVIEAEAAFRTPWQLSFGGRFAVNDKLTLNAQATRFGWSDFDAITLTGGVNLVLPEDYRDTWAVGGGFDLALDPRWTVRGGIQFDQTPTQDGHRDARVPDGDRWNFAAGASYAFSPAFTIDAAANYLTVNGASIDKATYGLPTAPSAPTDLRTPILVNGRLTDASVVVLSIGGRVKF